MKSEFVKVLSLDADFEQSSFANKKVWVNPPWSLQQRALEKVLEDVPSEFVMLGVLSKKPWATTLRAMGCLECILPKSIGNVFFTQLLSNGEYKPLRFLVWDLVAFYGTREQILLHKRALLDSVERLAVSAVTTTAPRLYRHARTTCT